MSDVLIILSHPEPEAFNKAVLAAVIEGVAIGGGQATVADLWTEGFDPRITAADLAHYRGDGDVPADVLREQNRVDQADAIAFVFPIYWWSMPALLKGWVDRVLTNGWAYGVEETKVRGLLRPRPVCVIATGSGDARGYARHGYREAFSAQVERGIFGYCGLSDVAVHLLLETEAAKPEVRLRHLQVARAAGAALFQRRN